VERDDGVEGRGHGARELKREIKSGKFMACSGDCDGGLDEGSGGGDASFRGQKK
jgi:hypothetical protein